MSGRKLLKKALLLAVALAVLAAGCVGYTFWQHSRIDALIVKLASKDTAEAAEAANQLSKYPSPYAIRRLVETAASLSAEDCSAYHAQNALVAMGPAAVDSLCLYLEGRQPGGADLKERLLFMLLSVEDKLGISDGGTWLVFGFAAGFGADAKCRVARETLTRIGEPAVPRLIALASAPEVYTRRNSILVLAPIGGKAASEAIEKATNDESADVQETALAMARLLSTASSVTVQSTDSAVDPGS